MWETTCGAVIMGEDSLEAALREVKEEIGITLSPIKGKCLLRIKRQSYDVPNFVDVWLFKEEIDITKAIYQAEEVCGAKWATPKEIKALIEMDEFTNTFSYLYDLFNEV